MLIIIDALIDSYRFIPLEGGDNNGGGNFAACKEDEEENMGDVFWPREVGKVGVIAFCAKYLLDWSTELDVLLLEGFNLGFIVGFIFFC